MANRYTTPKNADLSIEQQLNQLIEHYKKLLDVLSQQNSIALTNKRMLTSLMMDTYKKQMVDMGLFDENYYKKQYPQFKKYGISALDHYLTLGWQMFYNPSETFNTRRYIRALAFALQQCPLVHFLQEGRYQANYAYFSKYPDVLTPLDKNKKRCVYTCLVGNYDKLEQPTYVQQNWDYICFTDNNMWLKAGKIGVWNFKSLLRNDLDLSRINRYHKLLPHVVLPEYDESLYIDANVNILTPFIFDLIEARGEYGLLLPYHFSETCAYNHAQWILSAAKDEEEPIIEFLDIMKKNKFPHNWGMTENNVIFRNHRNNRIATIMEEWWRGVIKYCVRDQLTLSYCLWKEGISLKDVCFSNARSNIENFKLTFHQ